MGQQPTLIDLSIGMVERVTDNLAASAPPNVPPWKIWTAALMDSVKRVADAYERNDANALERDVVILTATAMGFCADTQNRLDQLQRRR